MKRQRNGVNFDEGLALQSQEEWDLLFVDARHDELARLVNWWKAKAMPRCFLVARLELASPRS